LPILVSSKDGKDILGNGEFALSFDKILLDLDEF
jgi:hypothetical protein